MNPELISRFVVNASIHSVIVFAAALGLVELFLKIFRLGNARWKYGLRLLPFFKVIYDGVAVNLPQWSAWHGIALFHLPPKSKYLSIGLGVHYIVPTLSLSLTTVGNYWFRIGDVLCEQLGPLATQVLAALVILASLTGAGLALMRVFRRGSAAALFPGEGKIRNPLLRQSLERHGVRVWISRELSQGACVAGLWPPRIILPGDLAAALTPEQLEAVVAHELEHVRWRDNWTLGFIECFRAFLWYLPGGAWLMRRAILQRELACDAGCGAYGIRNQDMQAALLKAMQLQAPKNERAFSAGLTARVSALQRLLALETLAPRPWSWKKKAGAGLAFTVCAMALLGSLIGL